MISRAGDDYINFIYGTGIRSFIVTEHHISHLH